MSGWSLRAARKDKKADPVSPSPLLGDPQRHDVPPSPTPTSAADPIEQPHASSAVAAKQPDAPSTAEVNLTVSSRWCASFADSKRELLVAVGSANEHWATITCAVAGFFVIVVVAAVASHLLGADEQVSDIAGSTNSGGPFQLRAQRSTCSNWQDIQLGEVIYPGGVDECGQSCQAASGCTGFSYEARQCSKNGSDGLGACKLWKGPCTAADIGCWDTYAMGALSDNSQIQSKNAQTYCSNWAAISLGIVTQEKGADACLARCLNTSLCVGFGYGTDRCSRIPDASGSGECRLWRDDCKAVHDPCWDDYRVTPRTPSSGEDSSSTVQRSSSSVSRVLPSVQFSIVNLSSKKVYENATMWRHMQTHLAETVASRAGFGIRPKDVKIDTSPDSDTFKAVVKNIPHGVDPANVTDNLHPAQDFVTELAIAVSSVPGVEAVAQGPMNLVMQRSEAAGPPVENEGKGVAKPETTTTEGARVSVDIANFQIDGLDFQVVSRNKTMMDALVKYIKDDVATKSGVNAKHIAVKVTEG